MTEPQADTPEDYQFSSRLIGSFLLAIVAYMAVGKSIYIELVTGRGGLGRGVHRCSRFGLRAAWSLLGSPLVFWWAFVIWRAAQAARDNPIIV